MSEHRAWFRENHHGGWDYGCDWCRTSGVSRSQTRVEDWVSGHDSAVVCQRDVARSAPPTFAPTGPGDAITLGDLREVADTADSWFGGEAEILFPAEQPPLVYVFTPPTEEGWHREMLAVLHLDSGTIERPGASPIAGEGS